MIKKAMILAAGFGKRLNPLTLDCPKPLLKIGEKTLLSNTLRFLENAEIKEVIINVHYLADQIIDYVKNKKFHLKINIINEKEKILETGGGILNALTHFDESFICINPDTIWNLNYVKELKKMENDFFFKNKKCCLLVVDKKKSFDKNLKGDFNFENGLVKRKNHNNLKYLYTGLQIINPVVFKNIKEKVFSINKIWNELIDKDELYVLESNIDFLHVSTLDIYNKIKH